MRIGRNGVAFRGPVLLLAGGIFWLAAAGLVAQSTESATPNEWLVGKARVEQLRRPITTTWNEVPLARALDQLANTQRISIFRDRRVDPTVAVKLDVRDQSVFEALRQVLDQQELAGCWFGDIYYVASPADVAQLLLARRELIESIRQRESSVQRALLSRADLQWSRLAQPGDLLQQLLDQAGRQRGEWFEPREQWSLPHDLWPEFGAENVTRADALLLVVHGFGRRIEFAEGAQPRLQLVKAAEFNSDATVEIALEVPAVEAAVQRDIRAQLAERWPTAEFVPESGTVRVRARAGELAAMQMLIDGMALQGTSSTASSGGRKVVTVRTRASIGSVLASAAKNLEVEFSYPPELREVLAGQIDLDVAGVTYEELIETALRDTGLQWELTESALTIRENPPGDSPD